MRPNSSPASRIASLISKYSSYGPNTSRPGWPDMPCRSAATFLPLMVMKSVRKNLMSAIGPPFSFSITCEAFGPWIWNRYWVRVTALPSGRDGERSSLTSSTSQSPVSAWN